MEFHPRKRCEAWAHTIWSVIDKAGLNLRCRDLSQKKVEVLKMILCDSSILSNWIQALASVGIVVLTILTLIVLRRYAADTKTIAKVSASQTENATMPILVVVKRTNITPNYREDIWSIKIKASGLPSTFASQGTRKELMKHPSN